MAPHVVTLSCSTSALPMCKAYFDTFEVMTPHLVTLSCLTSAFPMCKAYFDTFEPMTPRKLGTCVAP